jgi:hypothetical protein
MLPHDGLGDVGNRKIVEMNIIHATAIIATGRLYTIRSINLLFHPRTHLRRTARPRVNGPGLKLLAQTNRDTIAIAAEM